MIIWITGAPGSGKTTLARAWGIKCPCSIQLDGDEVRTWLTPDCGFSDEDRLKHATRVYKVAELISACGGLAIVALVAHPPGKVDRLIWVDGPARKGMWKGTAYTPPEDPDEVVDTWRI